MKKKTSKTKKSRIRSIAVLCSGGDAPGMNAALRAAGIEIAFPQRIVRLEQNDNASNKSPQPHRAGTGSNLPPRGGENLADTANASPSSGDSLTK